MCAQPSVWLLLLGLFFWSTQAAYPEETQPIASDCTRAQERLASQLDALRTALQARIEDLKGERDLCQDELRIARLNLDQSRHLVEDLVQSLADCQQGKLEASAQRPDPDCQAQLKTFSKRLAQAEIQSKRLRAQVIAQEEEIAQLQKQLEEVESLRLQVANLESELADQEQNAEAEIQSLQLQIVSAHAERDNLQAALNESEWELEGVKQKLLDTQQALKIARARLPRYAGGSGLSEHLRQKAADGFRKLRAFYAHPHPELSLAEWRKERQRLQEGIAKWQEALASTLGMRLLYQVQSQDTLEKISERFYGTPAYWQQIYAANRHLIDDPQRPLPGITLILPDLTPLQ